MGQVRKKGDLAVAVCLFGFGAATAVLSLGMRIGSLRSMGTGFFPFVLGVLLMVLSSIYAGQLLLAAAGSARAGEAAGELGAGGDRPIARRAGKLGLDAPTKQVVLSLGILALVAALFTTIGYLLSCFIIMVLFLRLLGTRKWLTTLGMSAATALASYVVFVKLLKVLLPKGLVAF